MSGWALPLRIARRTVRRALGRTLLVAALVGLPVAAATWIGTIYRATSPTGEVLATTELGQADARLDVSPYRALEPLRERPSLAMDDPAPAAGAGEPVRDPSAFDPRPLLPSGTKLARQLTESGSVDIRGPRTDSTAIVVTGDGQDDLTRGTYRLDSGRYPVRTDEVAVSPALAEYLGIRDGESVRSGATLMTKTGQRFTVVGLARTLSTPEHRTVFAPPRSPLAPSDPERAVRYLALLPAGTDADALTDRLVSHGLVLLPRANIVDPPPGPYGDGGQDAAATAVMALVIGFGILEIVLLAGTAFAVGARRQTRELGLVLAAGGTARDVRRIVLAQGLFAGLLGSSGGLVLSLGAVVAGKPLWERMTGTLITAWQFPWTSIVVIGLLGLFAGLAAAVIPAVTAGRQTPMAALAGRFTVSTTAARIRKPAVVLLVAGVACVLVGSALIAAAFEAAKREHTDPTYAATVTPEGPIALVLLGIVSVIAALIWMLPSLIAKVAAVAWVLPLSARLAVRDAARHRHRTGPAAAAIMMAVGGTAALSFASANMVAADAETYVPAARHGDAVLSFDIGGSGSLPYSAATVRQVADLLPVDKVYEISQVASRSAKPINGWVPPLLTATTTYPSGNPLLPIDPDYVERFEGYGPKAAAALRAGQVVVLDEKAAASGRTEVLAGDGANNRPIATLPATFAGPPPRQRYLMDHDLVSLETARKLGVIMPFEVQFDLTRAPTDDELAAVASLLGRDDALVVEQGYQSPARAWLIGLLTAATVVTLLGVAISVALSAAEGRSDLATLAAVGAPPRRRRNLAAAQAWVLGQLGCLLGVGVGALYGYTAHAAFGSPYFAVPWREIGGIVLLVPLFAAVLAWSLTRSRLPMVSRIE